MYSHRNNYFLSHVFDYLTVFMILFMIVEQWTDDMKCPEWKVEGDDVLLRDCEGNGEPRRKDSHYKGGSMVNNSTSLTVSLFLLSR